MTKKASDKRRKYPIVISSSGDEQRFLRGMITHDLVQRGLDFDEAYAVANAVRERLGKREEITTEEIRNLTRQKLEELYGPDLPSVLVAPLRPVAERHVIYHGQTQPYSRGLLARSVHAAGVDFDRAYELIDLLEEELNEAEVIDVASEELARRIGDLLERFEGPDTARRYRLVRRLQRLEKPLVLYIGGASGIGKSTLSLELAPLLKIYRLNATDTIRQVMRMVFAPEMLPAIHTSSFELPPATDVTVDQLPPRLGDPDFNDALIAHFEEQSARIAVGVRAVVERAIAENTSVLVEGVHLYPPLVPFSDLDGAAHQVAILLTTTNPESHRARFLARSRFGQRRAERYLENFEAIRMVHEFLLQQAEIHDVPLLDTNHQEIPTSGFLRLLTSMLEKRLPQVIDERESGERPPALLLVIDGLADRPVRSLGGRTPLQAARTPTLDRLAREGCTGWADPVSPGVVPDTAAGSLALFGQSPLAMRRGPVEALGADLDLEPGDVALRGNFATLDEEGRVLDRRAGRIRSEARELAEALDRLELPLPKGEEEDDAVEVRVSPATEHRLAIVLRGRGLSAQIHGSDPGESALGDEPLEPRPEDPNDAKAARTARWLARFEHRARQVLAEHPANASRVARGLPPANAVLTRGAGMAHRLVPLEDRGRPLRVACVAGDRTLLGLARWLGATVISSDVMTANLDTDLAAKTAAALAALGDHDLVVLHFKGADIAAHDQRPDLKASFLEQIDEALARLLSAHPKPLRIAVAGDHATLSESGQHGADPLPVLIWGTGVEADEVETYDEVATASGELGRLPLQLLAGRLLGL